MYYGEWKNSTLGILLNSAKTEISQEKSWMEIV
jgi:hypothetical protein